MAVVTFFAAQSESYSNFPCPEQECELNTFQKLNFMAYCIIFIIGFWKFYCGLYFPIQTKTIVKTKYTYIVLGNSGSIFKCLRSFHDIVPFVNMQKEMAFWRIRMQDFTSTTICDNWLYICNFTSVYC